MGSPWTCVLPSRLSLFSVSHFRGPLRSNVRGQPQGETKRPAVKPAVSDIPDLRSVHARIACKLSANRRVRVRAEIVAADVIDVVARVGATRLLVLGCH